MVRDVLGIDVKRVFILLAAMAAVLFAAISMMPGEPAAQTASVNGKIVYSGFDPTLGDDKLGQEDIYTMNPDGTGVTNLTQNYSMPNWSPLGEAKDNPEWSPDGTKIVFDASALSDKGSCCSRNVYVMDADGANLERLTNTPSFSEGEDFQATWAPDGTWLAFVSTRNDPYDDRDVYRMDVDGTNQKQLTFVDPEGETPARVSDEQPSISPDGTKIAFASNTHYDDPNNGSYHVDQLDIYVMDAADGGNVERLTFDAEYAYPLEKRSQNPVWSPDGTRIAYESTVSGNSEIWVMNADGTGEPVNVSNHESWDSDPAWSPDGTQITFMSRRVAGQEDIWAVDAPPPSPTTAAAFSALDVGTNAALAASAPRNLTADSSIKAGSPDWGTAPPVARSPARSRAPRELTNSPAPRVQTSSAAWAATTPSRVEGAPTCCGAAPVSTPSREVWGQTNSTAGTARTLWTLPTVCGVTMLRSAGLVRIPAREIGETPRRAARDPRLGPSGPL